METSLVFRVRDGTWSLKVCPIFEAIEWVKAPRKKIWIEEKMLSKV